VELKVPVFGQREAECGNASLKAVCHYFGKPISARYLRELAGGTDDGIDHAGLVTAARATGASVIDRANGTVDELRGFLQRGLPPIVGWWSMEADSAHFDPAWTLAERRERDSGHYSVVSGIDADRILLMDPQLAARRWMPIRDFISVWYDTDTPAYERVDRWYMVVEYARERERER
jgi:ABC-type bacteriocin/lantibiotic exporter with double-glycine peptidase domain